MLIAHILFGVIGLIGSYLWAGAFLKDLAREKGSDSSLTISYVALLVWGGIAGVIVSGLILFSENPERFLGSSTFLLNMTAFAFLVLIEVSYLRLKSSYARVGSRVASAYSWTWICVTAFLDPSYPLPYLLLVYTIILLIVFLCARLLLES